MMKIMIGGLFGSLMVYLFATAPEKLPEQSRSAEGRCAFEVRALFDGVNAINDVARATYTKRIVGGGQQAGLKFGEDWQDPGVEKGPLPALFLRMTAARMEAKPPMLGLYLGSDAPINKSNLFTPEQMESFMAVKERRAPEFMVSEVAGQIGMYPDIAGVAPCVECHNNHKDSPKTDWTLGDVMGATTWTYPDAFVSAGDYVIVVEAMFAAVEEAYQQYLGKVGGFVIPVRVAEGWPEQGTQQVPTSAVFMAEVRRLAAPMVMDAFLPVETAEPEGSPCAS